MKLRNKKTGEIMDLECITIFDRPDKYNTGDAIDEFYALAELNEEWEDYTPKEPLIKDEKIRKIVRAWAEVNFKNGRTQLRYYNRDNRLSSNTDCIEFSNFTPFRELKDGDFYTIAELCGEEEEKECSD